MANTVKVVVASILAIACFSIPASASSLVAPATTWLTGDFLTVGFKCGMVDGKFVCGKKEGSSKKNDDDDDDDDDDDQPKKSKDKVIPKTCGKKVNCEAGFVKLEKPNKYGACCEAREGLPPPKQQEAEKCQFPGEVGTPPNCKCPDGTEFMGYKGCVKKVVQKICCTGKYPDGSSAGSACGGDEAALRKIMASSRKIADPATPPSSITCAPE
jgi:hypothetical protein